MITKEEYANKVEENKWFDSIKETIDYRFDVFEYWLKNIANVSIGGITSRGVQQIHTSQIIPTKPGIGDDLNFRRLSLFYDYIINPENFKIPFISEYQKHLIIK